MFTKAALFANIIGCILRLLSREVGRQTLYAKNRIRRRVSGSTPPEQRDKNIVIIGASFAGSFALRILVNSLPPDSRYRIVIIEPNSHFQFSWLLPRFCVVQGHEEKAFIPYGAWGKGAPEGVLQWVKNSVTFISKTHVQLEGGAEIPYEYLLIATGSGVKEGLPSRVNTTEKAEGMRLLQEMQKSVEAAKTVVVVGGGAAGVEVATDAKDLYPDKHVILVHSRDALMHRFGKQLQDEALEGMHKLGVEVILGDRVVKEDASEGIVELKSGRVLNCDTFINCTGQKPNSSVIQTLAPQSIAASGHIRVKPTLQVDDEMLPNIYACGDVADVDIPTPNARAAARQAAVAADNIIMALHGQDPTYIYTYEWVIDSFIKLTLGLHKSTTYIGNGTDCLLWRSKEGIDLMASMAWKQFGAKPFKDESWEATKD
ncbi:pyridine nucleotide-disulfide oxidoreductase domain-containing protein [Sarocladium implicatum]|nr:pyridine nucleotide-disulfide oxidoreductase domain-containing protein [Sarocladium implicatum]